MAPIGCQDAIIGVSDVNVDLYSTLSSKALKYGTYGKPIGL